MPQDNKLPEPGEFTRIFKRQHLGGQSGTDADKKVGETSGVFPATPPRTSEQAATQPAMTAPSVAAPSSGEPGEFTKYFTGGAGAKSTGGPTGGAPKSYSGVQRPGSPLPTRNPMNDSSGNFTDRFVTPKAEDPSQFGGNASQMGPAPDLSDRSGDESGSFDFGHKSLPSKKDGPGEYTALFGSGNVPPPPRPAAVAQAPLAPIMSDSPNSFSSPSAPARTLRDIPAATPPQRGPSEFTVVSSGRQQSGAPGSGDSVSEAPANSGGGGIKRMPLNINVSPLSVNPMAGMPGFGGGGMHMPAAHASMSGASVNTPLGSAHVQAPMMPPLSVPAAGGATSKMSDQTKLILFFGILAILAVVLIVVVVASQKN